LDCFCTLCYHILTRHHPPSSLQPEAEAVRAAQVRQLDRALTEIQQRWGLMTPAPEQTGGVPVVLMMDGNEAPHLAAYGPHRCAPGGKAHTATYRALTQELGWKDCLGEDFGPTSITLARRLRIDYILTKDSASTKLQAVEATPALDVRLAGVDQTTGRQVLVPREEEAAKAVYGLPLPAVGEQPDCPSDHLHVSARLTFGVVVGGGEEEGKQAAKEL
jgi:hypothetical protein